jgi:hypothetical protein
MSEMIERVTKAIEAAKMEWSSEDASADQWDAPADYLASAAVKAMREPTTAMITAGVINAHLGRLCSYRAMIDEALAEAVSAIPAQEEPK